MQLSLLRRSVCEVIRTYCLVLIGCGAMVVDNQTGLLTHVGVATVWGLIVMTMIYSIGDLSGAHRNPARSLGPAVMSNHYNLLWLYLTAPIVGAIAGGWLYRFVRGDDESDREECVMVKKVSAVVLFAFILGAGGSAAVAEDVDSLLRPNDRIAIIGGTFVERMQPRDQLEAELQTQRPDWKLSLRNLGWSGDTVSAIARKRFDNIEAGRARRLADIEAANPTVALIWYGQSEAGQFEENAARYQADLLSLVAQLKKQQIRVVLLTPVAMPGDRRPHYRAGLDAFEQMLRDVARAQSLALVELNWNPTDQQLVDDRMLPNELGYRELAVQLGGTLLGESTEPRDSTRSNLADAPERRLLLEAIARKNEFFFHRYRPQNETYLFLFRKHEQGNNAVEIEQFDPIIQEADQAIWDAAQPQ
ncbi:aquaporin [Rhodopirellula sp. P2]|uniref:aquaporin n=1 Tax=Rhodopirellula sp. P2 TaxID=2127060 RepID=UPI0023675018|nr:aquaporin [Rhodopirellula sp. P2]WDQ14765.1 aquaporin [Rhodopirellula sp. P2]